MAQGWQAGGRCLPNIEQAAAHACGEVFGVTSSGLLSCSGYTASGSAVTLSLSSGAEVPWQPQPCERIDWVSTWGPLFAAVMVAAVTLLGFRWLIDLFRRDYEA